MEKDLLAYCGLFCGDCAGYTGDIASAAAELADSLDRYQFQRTATVMFPEQVGDYDALRGTLAFLTELKCPATCRERSADDTDCQILACCVERGFPACYQCDAFESCSKLASLEALHGDSCIRNLRSIREMGLETWLAEGQRFWFGSDAED